MASASASASASVSHCCCPLHMSRGHRPGLFLRCPTKSTLLSPASAQFAFHGSSGSVSRISLSKGFNRPRTRGAATFQSLSINSTVTSSDFSSKHEVLTVGDFMTKRENLITVKPSTLVDEALESLVTNRVTGLPVIDDAWNLVGVVSDYDLLALDSISGAGRTEAGFFPEVESTWKAFYQLQKLLNKTNGKTVAEVMTPSPIVVRETTNLEDAARLLLQTKYRRLPVVDSSGKLVGILTRGNVIRAALDMKRNADEESA